MQLIPLSPVPSQKVSAVLSNQNCQLFIYLRGEYLFFDLNSNGTPVSYGTICRNGIPLNPVNYVGFLGNFVIADTQGSDDPTYDGLGSRYQLVYLTEDEYEQFFPE